MAFEEDLGQEQSSPVSQDYTLSSTGLVARTLSLLLTKFIRYLIIFGIAGAACVALSFVLLYSMFGIIGTIGADFITPLITMFMLTSMPDWYYLEVILGFGIFAFVLNAILSGAVIKFTLDEYGGAGGDFGTSFSHSISRLLNIIIVQLLITAMVAIIFTPASIMSDQALEMIDITDPFNPIFPPGSIELMMTSLGLMFGGGIFLIFIQIRLAPALAIIVDTDLSTIDSLKKSWGLTSGNMMHIIVAWILMGIVSIALSLFVTFGIIGLPFSDATLMVISAFLTMLLFGAINYIFGVVLYRDLSSQSDTSELPGFVM